MTAIETPRLILRPFKSDDLNELHAYCSNPNVGINAGWKPHESLEESKEILEAFFLNKENIWAIEVRSQNKLIGSIGLIDDPKRSLSNVKMMGYALDENYWNKGYTTEAAQAVLNHAFQNLSLDLVSIYTFPHNLRSKRVVEKCGFKYEGRLRKVEMLFNGDILDNDCFSIDKREFTATLKI